MNVLHIINKPTAAAITYSDFSSSITHTCIEELCRGLFCSTLEPIKKVLCNSKIDKRAMCMKSSSLVAPLVSSIASTPMRLSPTVPLSRLLFFPETPQRRARAYSFLTLPLFHSVLSLQATSITTTTNATTALVDGFVPPDMEPRVAVGSIVNKNLNEHFSNEVQVAEVCHFYTFLCHLPLIPNLCFPS